MFGFLVNLRNNYSLGLNLRPNSIPIRAKPCPELKLEKNSIKQKKNKRQDRKVAGEKIREIAGL